MSRCNKRVLFIPFLLDNVAGKPELNQADGIHPNHAGRADRRRHRVGGARAAARSDVGRFMIELRGVSKTVPSGAGYAHHPSSARPHDRQPGVSSRSPGRRAAASRRCSGCSPASTRRRAGRVVIDGVDITALDEDALARLRGHAHRLRLPVLPPAAVADRARERARCRWRSPAFPRPAAPRQGAAGRSRARRSRPSLSVAALGRRAAARRDRARAGQRSADPAGRRTDRQSGQRDRAIRSSTCCSASTGRARPRWCW